MNYSRNLYTVFLFDKREVGQDLENRMHRIHVIDSHTAGEPTRVVVSGMPGLGPGTMEERLRVFREKYDHFRSAIVNEPRGSDAVVGALLCEPVNPAAAAGVIFFNNVGYLGMCGHGTIGLITTLSYKGRIRPGVHRIETPVGEVTAELHSDGEVTVHNVPSYRHAQGVEVQVPGHGCVVGDIAWGGNWFFLIEGHPLEISISNLDALTEYSWAVRKALQQQGITGRDNQEIDHIELIGPALNPENDKRNFVLCPGRAYDRSPCGTGTSAKLACLYADGKLKPGQVWRQESVVSTVFEGSVRVRDGVVYPSIKGSAWINAEADLILDPTDPLGWGIRSAVR
jgi:4-hydroxyproline epimerase